MAMRALWLRPTARHAAVRHRPAMTRRRDHAQITRRHFQLPTVIVPPLLFTGLFVALWCWKCAMLVLFQNAIIYNPFIPPNARSMRIAEFARRCGGVGWREERILSLDGTDIALCVANVLPRTGRSASATPVYILYFQGNASSLPPRLPDLSRVLLRLQEANQPIHYTMVCLSYRGYWTSHDRPSERGIDMDAKAAMQWIHDLQKSRSADSDIPKPVVVLWGQSIGCGFATSLAATADASSSLPVNALVLETPFTSTRDMLKALYPQKWLPYQYLWPFLRSQLDSLTNLSRIAERGGKHKPGIYMVEAGKDELVPADHGARLYERCQAVGLPVERHTVRGALHNDAMVRYSGKNAIAQAISSAVARAGAHAAGTTK